MIPGVSPEEYLELDRAAEVKSEYRDGAMFPIWPVSFVHSRLVGMVFWRLNQRLQGGSSIVAVGPLRVRISPTKFLYPDVLVVSGGPALTDDHQDTITNPRVIVEVLSPATSNYDRASKFDMYRELASFEEYVLVSQDRILVETFRKTGKVWVLESFDGPEAVVTLHSLGISIPLSEIYRDIL